MQDKVRAKEATVQISKSGRRLSGSMLQIFDIDIQPEVDMQTPRTVGEARARSDLDVKGIKFTFQAYVRDAEWFALWQEIMSADEQGLPFPELSLAVTIAHRTGSTVTFVLHGDLTMHPTNLKRPESGYVTHTWNGYCAYMDGV